MGVADSEHEHSVGYGQAISATASIQETSVEREFLLSTLVF
jgi:hypothetical protein